MDSEWDEAKRLQNLKDHGVDFVDMHKVFAGPTFTFEDDLPPALAHAPSKHASVKVCGLLDIPCGNLQVADLSVPRVGGMLQCNVSRNLSVTGITAPRLSRPVFSGGRTR